MKYLISIFLFILSCTQPSSETSSPDLKVGNEYRAKVIGVVDGDTYDILWNNTSRRVRVDAIDAPEKGMPYYKVSKQYLADLCFGDNVAILIVDVDRHGRYVGRAANSDGVDISREMIKAGMAWHYKDYNDEDELAELENKARATKTGLWADAKIIAPWEVRKLHREGLSTKDSF
jgi:micrococcal nuclease